MIYLSLQNLLVIFSIPNIDLYVISKFQFCVWTFHGIINESVPPVGNGNMSSIFKLCIVNNNHVGSIPFEFFYCPGNKLSGVVPIPLHNILFIAWRSEHPDNTSFVVCTHVAIFHLAKWVTFLVYIIDVSFPISHSLS